MAQLKQKIIDDLLNNDDLQSDEAIELKRKIKAQIASTQSKLEEFDELVQQEKELQKKQEEEDELNNQGKYKKRQTYDQIQEEKKKADPEEYERQRLLREE